MTFPTKKVNIFGLKSASSFFFFHKKTKFVHIFILQGKKNVETVYFYPHDTYCKS